MASFALTLRRDGQACVHLMSSAGNRVLIGSDCNCDLIVTGVPAQWLDVAIDIDGTLTLRSSSVDTTVRGKRLEKGVCTITRPFWARLFKSDLTAACLGDLELSIARHTAHDNQAPDAGSISDKFARATRRGHQLLPLAMARFHRAGVVAFIALPAFIAAAWMMTTRAGTRELDIVRVSSDRPHSALLLARAPLVVPDRPIERSSLSEATQLSGQLRSALIRVGVQSPISIQDTPRGVVLSGTVHDGEVRAVKDIVERLKKQSGLPVLDQTASQEQALGPRILSASSKPGFVVLEDGRRLMVGDTVHDQWVLRAISSSEITLGRGTAVRKIARQSQP